MIYCMGYAQRVSVMCVSFPFYRRAAETQRNAHLVKKVPILVPNAKLMFFATRWLTHEWMDEWTQDNEWISSQVPKKTHSCSNASSFRAWSLDSQHQLPAMRHAPLRVPPKTYWAKMHFWTRLPGDACALYSLGSTALSQAWILVLNSLPLSFFIFSPRSLPESSDFRQVTFISISLRCWAY